MHVLVNEPKIAHSHAAAFPMGRSYRKRSADDDVEAAVLEPVASDEQMRCAAACCLRTLSRRAHFAPG